MISSLESHNVWALKAFQRSSASQSCNASSDQPHKAMLRRGYNGLPCFWLDDALDTGKENGSYYNGVWGLGVYWGYIGITGIMEKKMGTIILGLFEPWSKLLVSPLICPIVILYITPYITSFIEFRV